MTNENKSGKEPTDPDAKLKEVIKVQGPVEAEVIKSLLASHGITCLLKGLVVQSVHAFSADGLGEIRVFVDEKDYVTAQQLLKDRDRG